jgi:alpha-beta hydrolase superfamily lysophospholipase
MPIELAKTVARIATLIVAIIASIWIYRAYLARGLPELSIWHTHEVQNEFHADDYPDGITLTDYKALEARVFDELDAVVYSHADSIGQFNRYNKGSEVYPGAAGQRWNKTFELQNEQPSGGVLLIHGASDSPYSTRALAELFNRAGLYVLSVRLPGNGTIPSGLRDARLPDWLAITRMGVQHVRESIGEELPLYIAGYSVGGALAVDYSLDSIADEALETPERLFLYTPAIGVSVAARFSSWDLVLSKLSVFEKFNWLSVEPEFDPYKFNSFAKEAGHITYLLTMQLEEKMKRLDDASLLPPIIAFQSLVDSTIQVPTLIDRLYTRLAVNGSELILFDINRAHDIEHFIRNSEDQLVQKVAAIVNSPFTYTLVTNDSGESLQVVARTRLAGATEFSHVALDKEWPGSVYSLSHVALVFEPDDRWYGGHVSEEFKLGTLAPRGETAILRSPIGRFMRLRHNPFFEYLAERTLNFCAACDKDRN